MGNKKELTQPKIVNAAVRLLSSHGFTATTPIPILENIEISKGYPPRQFFKAIILERLDFIEKNRELIQAGFSIPPVPGVRP